MERNHNQTDPEETTVCNLCGEEYEQPVLAELHSGNIIEEYYACPRCLTKVGEVEHEHEKRADAEEIEEENEVPMEEVPAVESAKPDDVPPCPYHLGYLRKRDKAAPIPEGCFTCTKMIECL